MDREVDEEPEDEPGDRGFFEVASSKLPTKYRTVVTVSTFNTFMLDGAGVQLRQQ